MKLWKKIATVAVAGLLGLGTLSFAACSDPYANMTTINVHYFNGGLGDDWIMESISQFEAMFANVSFEDGKTGVHVSLTANKEFNELATSMSTGAEGADIIYSAEGDRVEFLNTPGILYDTTAIATEKVYDANGEVHLNAAGNGFEVQADGYSMYDRMLPYYREAYNLAGTKWATNDGDVSFSLLPYEDTIAGIIIDYDFYEELCAKYKLTDKMTGYKYEGDAVAMPGTWDEFFALLTNMRDKDTSGAGGVSGFMYSIDYYTPSIETAVIADVDGTDEGVTDPSKYSGIRMFDTYRGAYDFNNNGTIDEGETITSENYWKLTQTRGMEAMVQVAVRLFEHGSNGNEIYDNGVMNNPSYSSAQMDFVMSKNSSTAPRILAILEGDWWENEARSSFDSMGKSNPEDAYGKRTFRMMPIPHMTAEEVENGKTYKVGSFSNGYPLILNNKTLAGNPAKETVAKLWVQFTHSNSQMNQFTKWSGSVRPYDYKISAEAKAQLTPFAQSVVTIQEEDRKEDGKIEIVRRSDLLKSDEARLSTEAKPSINFMTDKYGNAAIIANMVTMRKDKKSWTGDAQIESMVEEYMNGMLAKRGHSKSEL